MRNIILLAMLLFTINAHAGNAWYFGLTIKDVRAQNKDGQTSFRTIEPINNPGNCPNTDYYAIRSDNDPKFAMSILLAAYMGGKKVDIYVVGDQCGSFGRPSVTHIRIRD